jgi:hypothetical protein
MPLFDNAAIAASFKPTTNLNPNKNDNTEKLKWNQDAKIQTCETGTANWRDCTTTGQTTTTTWTLTMPPPSNHWN